MKKNEYRVMKRIFIGVKIEPGTTLINMISDFRTSLKNERLKWTGIDNLHITVEFLGDTGEEIIMELDKMLRVVCEGTGPFRLVVSGAGVFRSPGDPRILWAGIVPSEELNRLHMAVMKGLKETGIGTEERAFNPHLTIARIKGIQAVENLKSLIDKYSGNEIQTQLVSDVILYESLLSPAGAIYKPLARYPLRQLT
jgi:RNA 2',3'-cyclic 3'-phosphodiesterase